MLTNLLKSECLTLFGLMKAAPLCFVALIVCLNRDFRAQNSLLLWFVFWAMALICAAGLTHDGMPFGALVVSLIIVLRRIETVPLSGRQRVSWSWIAMACLALSFAFALRSAKVHYGEYRSSVRYYAENPDCISFQNRVPSPFNRYVFCPPFSMDRNAFHNVVIADYFAKPFAMFLPKVLFDNLYLKDGVCHEKNLFRGERKCYSVPGYLVYKMDETESPDTKVSISYNRELISNTWLSRLMAYVQGKRGYSAVLSNTVPLPYFVATPHGRFLILDITEFCKAHIKEMIVGDK